MKRRVNFFAASIANGISNGFERLCLGVLGGFIGTGVGILLFATNVSLLSWFKSYADLPFSIAENTIETVTVCVGALAGFAIFEAVPLWLDRQNKRSHQERDDLE